MGRWLANFLLEEGNEVIITGRNERKLLEAKQQLGIVEATTDNVEAVKRTDVVLISVSIDSFEDVVEHFGPRPILFGTNMPRYTGTAAVSMLTYADISTEAREAIAGGNLRNLLKEALS